MPYHGNIFNNKNFLFFFFLYPISNEMWMKEKKINCKFSKSEDGKQNRDKNKNKTEKI